MPWGPVEKESWFKEQTIKRSYLDEVATKVEGLTKNYVITQYGALSQNPKHYPIYILRSKNWDEMKKTILITGGVHGYETSGVHGAIAFLEKAAPKYFAQFNFVCAPCISPWSYETINRWNSKALDPNRNFKKDSPAEECALFLKEIDAHGIKPFAHFDLHETTDTDNSVFRPALAARDGVEQKFSEIPDGFYVVGDTANPHPEFQKAIIDAVRPVTHIAPHDENGEIIGDKVEQEGVINYPIKKLFLCAGFSDAEYTTTTEVYPDSPKATPQICIDAQVAAIEGGLKYLAALK